MISPSSPAIDSRRALQIVQQLLARRPGYLPEWVPTEKGAGAALAWIHARYVEAVLQRLNQVPHKSKLAFLELLGIEMIPAQAARAPIVVRLAKDAAETRLPLGSQIAAPPPPEKTDQFVFETVQGIGLSPARLQRLVSLWPGRDQYIDHGAAFAEGKVVRPFLKSDLKDTPHVLYLAHDTLLALAGKVQLDVELELSQSGNEPLDLVWEYWDGKVWRGFRAQHPECAETDEKSPDATAGLTRNGKVRLKTDCAESAKMTVGGVEAFWIRAVLDEPLPLDPKQILPEVNQIRLSTVVERSLSIRLHALEPTYRESKGVRRIAVVLEDVDQGRVENAEVRLTGLSVTAPEVTVEGEAEFLLTAEDEGKKYELEVLVGSGSLRRKLTYAPPCDQRLQQCLAIQVQLGGLLPDSAYAGAEALDLTKAFYPLGQNPQPGTAFYFSSAEAFSKPGARLQLQVRPTRTPQQEFGVHDSTRGSPPPVSVEHRVIWEYWNGRYWVAMLTQDQSPASEDFTEEGVIEFVVPPDIAPTKVNDEEALWMRVRLAQGAYGRRQQVTWTDGGEPNSFTYFIPTPPALLDFRLAYIWEYGPFHAEHVLAYNDFRFEDFTAEAKWPGTVFQPYSTLTDLTPALYLGFDRRLPADRTNLYLDLIEGKSASAPVLVWEYWNGFNWRPFTVEDETRDLLYPGMVSFIGPADAAQRSRFGDELFWLRARLKEDGPPQQPQIRAIHPNAVWAAQWQTVVGEVIGTSNGLPGQVLTFKRAPVLDGERLEVRELLGASANVEWRLVAMEVLGNDYAVIQELEDLLGREGLRTEVEKGDLRLRRDRNKRVTEVWVRWKARRHLFDAKPNDRCYVLERARGRVIFGDGEHGKVPPLDAEIQAREYRTGGGIVGNVAQGAISQLLTGVAGAEAVFNARPAEGGADGEILEALASRGPSTIRHRGRALTASDLVAMAKEASPAVAVARAIAARDPQGIFRPGWVTLVIIPRSEERRPWPSFGLREHVRKHIEKYCDATLAAARQLYVTGPEYHEIDVEMTLASKEAADPGVVATAAQRAVETFLHPLQGGPERRGWDPGSSVHLSDVATVLERVDGVDYVRALTLLLQGVPQGERVSLSATETVVAGEIRVLLVQS